MVQLAHPGRMSPAGAGNRPADLAPICPSSVPVRLGESWLDKIVGHGLSNSLLNLSAVSKSVDSFWACLGSQQSSRHPSRNDAQGH